MIEKQFATVEPIEGVEVIAAHRADDNTYWLTVECPQGWADVKKLTKKILRFEGRIYRWRSWNSDRNVSNFLSCPAESVAQFVVPKK